MADQPRQRQVPFLAPVIARVLAPITEPARRIAEQAQLRGVTEVPCPRCGAACALLDPRTRLLHACGQDGGIGVPLSGDHRASTRVRCDQCGWHSSTSGRAVARNLHNGRPLLA
jgi:hypothetical protein